MALYLPGLVPRDASVLKLTLALLCGACLGLTPSLLTLHTIFLLTSFLFLRLPLLLVGVWALVCWMLGYLGLDNLINSLGSYLLRAPGLQSFWVQAYNLPVIPWTRFNNSMVLGAAVGSVLLLPLWIGLSFNLKRSVLVRG